VGRDQIHWCVTARFEACLTEMMAANRVSRVSREAYTPEKVRFDGGIKQEHGTSIFERMCKDALEDGVMSQAEHDRAVDDVATGRTTRDQVIKDWTPTIMSAASLKTAASVSNFQSALAMMRS
jgi:hypothetical protein